MNILEKRVIELETRLAYQDDIVLTLNDVVARQQRQIERLEAAVRQLVERVQRLSALADGQSSPLDERPPHY